MRYNSIQVLRAIAALLVLWAHMRYVGDFSNIAWTQTAAGAVGVDIFFVISGFVIAISAENLNYNVKSFIINRISRVVPLCWLLSVPFLAFSLWKGWDINWISVSNTFLFIPIFDLSVYTNPLHPFGWTLSFEIWFYILFSILLCFHSQKASRVIILIFPMACAVVSLVSADNIFIFKFLFHPFALEFVFGVVIYKVSHQLGFRSGILSAVAALILGYFVLQTERLGWHMEVLSSFELGIKRSIIWGGFGASLVIFCVSIDSYTKVKWPQWLLMLGNCSYSIYLVQPYCVHLTGQLNIAFKLHNFTAMALYVLSALILGVLISRTIEMRLTKITKNFILSFITPQKNLLQKIE